MPRNNLSLYEELQRYHWYEIVKRETLFSHAGLSMFPDKDVDSKISLAWKNREGVASIETIEKFVKAAPIAATIVDCAPYRLLANEELSAEEVTELISVYRGEPGSNTYTFPCDGFTTNMEKFQESNEVGITDLLSQRGDLYAFFAILAMVREAEANADEIAHFRHLRALYACLPSLGRYEWLRTDFGLLCQAVEAIHQRVELSRSLLGVDWNIVEEQFNDQSFEPDPQRRPIDPDTGRPIAIANPTFLVKASNVGSPPRWIGDIGRASPQKDAAESPTFDYDRTTELLADQILLMSFIQTMGLWEVGRNTWEACLGVSSQAMSAWLSHADVSLGLVPRVRILALITVREFLHRKEYYRKNPGAAVRAKSDFLQGKCIVDYLKTGNTLGLLKRFDEDPDTPKRIGHGGMLPIIPTGVLRIPKWAAKEMGRQNFGSVVHH